MKRCALIIFSFLLIEGAQAQKNPQKLSASRLIANHKDQKECTILLAEKIKNEVFDKNAPKESKFTINKEFGSRKGLDGLKVWFQVTGKNAQGAEETFQLNIRVKFGKDPKLNPQETCQVNIHTGYPLYVLDHNGDVLAEVVGKYLYERAGDGLIELIFPAPPRNGNGGFFE